MPDQVKVPRASLLGHTGAAYFPIAFVARLPFAMMVVGVLTLAVAARGSLSLGGLTSAMVGLGTACLGPLLGAAADRFGQRLVLLSSGLVNGALLAGFAWVVGSALPGVAVLVTAFLIGATAPQVGPMSRSRLVRIIAHRVLPARRGRTLSVSMAYESAADETVFVIGPFLVGALAAWLAPWAPLVVAGVLSAVFVSAFALHPTGSSGHRPGSTPRTAPAPARELRRPALVTVVVGTLGMGLFFGAMLTSLTAFMADLGEPERAGLVYGAMGVGSAVCALAVGLLPERFGLSSRWLAFAGVQFAGALALPFVGSLTALTIAMALAGLGIGPTLVTQYSLGARHSPVGRSATVMTLLGSGVIVGQASASALTGEVAQRFGATTALCLPVAAVAVILLAGVAHTLAERAGLPQVDVHSQRPTGGGGADIGADQGEVVVARRSSHEGVVHGAAGDAETSQLLDDTLGHGDRRPAGLGEVGLDQA